MNKIARRPTLIGLVSRSERLLGAFCGSIRRGMALLMAISMAFHSGPAKAWEFDFESVFQQLTSSKEPLDERSLLEYNHLSSKDDRKRSDAVLAWVKKSKYHDSIESFLRVLNTRKPNLSRTLANRGVGQEQLLKFFAESLLLFSVLKNQNTAMIENQYSRFRSAWLSVDLRFLPKSAFTLWSAVLIGILRLSLQSLEPWTESELDQVQRFMESKEELNSQSAKPIVKQISKLASFEPKDPNFILVELTSILVSGLPTATASMAVLFSLSLNDYVKSFANSSPPAFALCVLGGVFFFLGSCYLNITQFPQRFIPIFHKRFSYIFRHQKFDCRRFLTETVDLK